MQSIDRLREWMENATAYGPSINGEFPRKHAAPWFGWKSDIEALIDAIEREVGELERFKTLHREPFIEMEQFVERLRDAAEDREDVTLFGVDYTALPVDADGVPFHIGDKVDSDHYENGMVIGIHYFRAPNGVVFEEIAVQPDGWDTATWRDPEEYAHHHAPTVEDVLREFADRVCNSGHQWGLDAADTIAEYAAKLRLAGEE